MKHGFIKVAAAVPAVKVADVEYNIQQIESLIAQAEGRGVEVLVFPELCITGYTCQDLFKEQLLLDRAESAIASHRQRSSLQLRSRHSGRTVVGHHRQDLSAQLCGILREALVCFCTGPESFVILLCRRTRRYQRRPQIVCDSRRREVRC